MSEDDKVIFTHAMNVATLNICKIAASMCMLKIVGDLPDLVDREFCARMKKRRMN